MEDTNEVENVEENVDSKDTDSKDSTNWQAEASKFQRIAKRSETKIAKLEKELESFKGQHEDAKPPEKPSQSSDLDYGQKAFLKASGINGADELALVKEQAKVFNGTLDELIDNPYFKQKLDTLRTNKANAEAADGGNNRTGPGSKNTVEYWLQKGEMPPKELGKKLQYEYLDARKAAEGDGKMFYND